MANGKRAGFFDTFRVGWAPAKRVGGKRVISGSAGRPASGRGRPASRGAAARAKRGSGAPAAAGRNASRAGHGAAAPELIKRKNELSRQYAQLQWDLGGIFYEMARRDHYRIEVLNAQAAKLQEIDAELGQIERLVKLDEAGAASDCPSCGALQARGASFCWSCGKPLPGGAATSEAAKKAKPRKAASRPNSKSS